MEEGEGRRILTLADPGLDDRSHERDIDRLGESILLLDNLPLLLGLRISSFGYLSSSNRKLLLLALRSTGNDVDGIDRLGDLE